MTPTTRSQTRQQLARAQAQASPVQAVSTPTTDTSGDDEMLRGPNESSSSFQEADQQSELWSPHTRLWYRADKIGNEETTMVTREVFDRGDPPHIVLSRCRLHERVYAFEMKEQVRRTVRIGPRNSKYSKPTCEACSPDDSDASRGVCRHIVWLLDQVAKQTLYNLDPSVALTMGPDGYATELDTPYGTIAGYHLDLLASRLHCRVASPAGDPMVRIDASRLAEVRSMLATVTERSWDAYGAQALGTKRVKRGDLDCTVFRMLYDNDAFFHYFRSQMDPRDPIHDRFRQLHTLAGHVLELLDRYHATQDRSGGAKPATAAPEGHCDVVWAAGHLENIALEIKAAVERTHPASLDAQERQGAADLLVYMLGEVTARNYDVGWSLLSPSDRNLYHRLIGSRDGNFVIETLSSLADETVPNLDRLWECWERVRRQGAPESYCQRFHAVMSKVAAGTR